MDVDLGCQGLGLIVQCSAGKRGSETRCTAAKRHLFASSSRYTVGYQVTSRRIVAEVQLSLASFLTLTVDSQSCSMSITIMDISMR